ncbi:MAG: hypothetical protein NWE78_02440 [Candidatus Bathyarchaeota archaeon]|nr:hypothetical protein [Candidatus Bathyarchaeota archaeon]
MEKYNTYSLREIQKEKGSGSLLLEGWRKGKLECTRAHDKYVMVMAVYSGFGGKKSNEYMNEIFASFFLNVVASLELQIATKSEQETRYNHEQTMNAFNTLIARIQKGERNPPTMTQLILFNLYKSISEYAKDYFEADYQYYKDKTNYHYDTDINPDMDMKAKQIVLKELQKMMDPSSR